MKRAMLSEKSEINVFADSKFVDHRISVFGQASCENDYFIKFSHLFKEIETSRSYHHINITHNILQINLND